MNVDQLNCTLLAQVVPGRCMQTTFVQMTQLHSSLAFGEGAAVFMPQAFADDTKLTE